MSVAQKSIVDKRIIDLFSERFPEPTEIQRKAFPVVYSGKNTLIVAPTGLGKTEAAILPVFSRVLESNPKPISTLYITPLKALNRDIFDRMFWWADKLGISVGLRHGDTTQTERGKQTKKPPQVLVTTPESLQSLLPARIMGKHLSNVKWVIVDEVHELLDSKRGTQLVLALKRLSLRADFQVIALSATIGDVETAKRFFGLEEVVTLGKQRKIDVSVEMPEPTSDDVSTSKKLGVHPVIVARLRRLHELVEEHGAVLTFVNTRSMAELLSSRYSMWDKAHDISVHHSSLSKDVRLLTESKFRKGKLKGIIATSSLELGIDIGNVDLVIQYMSPRQVSRLVQRIGRSGHRVGKVPKGVILANDEEDALESGVIADLAKKGKLEKIQIYNKPLDVLAHQLVGLSLDIGRVRIDDAYNLIRETLPYQGISWSEFTSVLHQLENERLVWLNENSFKARRYAYKYYFENLSTIPDEKRIWLVNRITGKTIAGLDELFVSDNLRIGCVFITRGLPWRVVDITDNEVVAEPATDYSAGIPDWVGEDIPVPKEVASLVSESWSGRLPKSLSKETATRIARLAKKLEFYPTQRHIIVESQPGQTVIHSPFGTKINQTLAHALSAYIAMTSGRSINIRADPYRILLDVNTKLVKQALDEIPYRTLENFLSAHLARSSMFKSRFIHVAKRFGLLSRDVDYSRMSMRRLMDAMVDSPVYEEAIKEVFHDKFDIDGTKDLLDKVQAGVIKVDIWVSSKPSILSQFSSSSGSYFLPERPKEEIREIIKERIMSSYVGLQCMNCGAVMYSRVSNLPDKIVCNKCGGQMLTLVDVDESKRLKVAHLINSFGKTAIIALLGRGVGPDTAARILRRFHKSIDDLIDDVIEAERTFSRTHRFWKN